MNKLSSKNRRNSQKLIKKRIVSESTDNLPPLFSFQYTVKGFDLSACDLHCAKKVIDLIDKFSKVSWRDSKSTQRHGIGFEKISDLKKDITEEFEGRTILSCSLSEIMRFLGFREQQIFYVLWIDKTGEIYRH